jgi:hypothetical protein
MKMMQLGNPYPLSLVNFKYIPKARSRAIEMVVHAKLADYAIGREWFRVSIELIRRTLSETIDTDKVVHAWNPTRDTYAHKNLLDELLARE